jgi:hypothetical protein
VFLSRQMAGMASSLKAALETADISIGEAY